MRRDYPRGVLPTDRRYTGQRQETFGLYDYRARYYSPVLGRFVSADTIVPDPDDPQTLNRYAYGGNNPILYNDPDGRCGPLCGTFLLVGTLAALTIALDEYVLEPAPGPGEYNARESYRQAVELASDWFNNIEPRQRSFGPESSLTQDIMHDIGMVEFRQKWAEAGYPLPWSWAHTRDEREKGPAAIRFVKGMGAYTVENYQLLLTAIGIESDTPAGPIDAVGGVIGSLDGISVYPAERGMVKIEVYNEMNWDSGLRVPGFKESLAWFRIPGTGMSVGEYLAKVRGWGKTPLEQTFYWWEPLPGATLRTRPGR
jgi:RHS repeat-associated protein